MRTRKAYVSFLMQKWGMGEQSRRLQTCVRRVLNQLNDVPLREQPRSAKKVVEEWPTIRLELANGGGHWRIAPCPDALSPRITSELESVEMPIPRARVGAVAPGARVVGRAHLRRAPSAADPACAFRTEQLRQLRPALLASQSAGRYLAKMV